MSLSTLDSIKTMSQLRAEQNSPVVQDLDRNAFLRLITTQLQNQNPLDPMKNEAFLAQFSTLEATTAMSSSLSEFVSGQQQERMLRGANLLGKQVFAPDVAMYQPGSMPLDGVVKLDQVVDNLRLYVVDARTSQIVNQMDLVPQIPGDVAFGWNGGNFEGEPAEAGTYMFKAVGYVGDQTMDIPALAQAKITGVSWDQSLGEIFVEIQDGRVIALSEISHISE
ncbi:MAG: flagellar hook capping FlgD N-terminal domain-containing protein [Betaproteobacteria bacterium]